MYCPRDPHIRMHRQYQRFPSRRCPQSRRRCFWPRPGMRGRKPPPCGAFTWPWGLFSLHIWRVLCTFLLIFSLQMIFLKIYQGHERKKHNSWPSGWSTFQFSSRTCPSPPRLQSTTTTTLGMTSKKPSLACLPFQIYQPPPQLLDTSDSLSPPEDELTGLCPVFACTITPSPISALKTVFIYLLFLLIPTIIIAIEKIKYKQQMKLYKENFHLQSLWHIRIPTRS